MSEYTYKDVIIDPDDPRVEIGKEYYFGNNPGCLLRSISQLSASEGTLVMKDSAIEAQSSPFMSSEGEWFVCIIRKKEPEKKYVPFDFDDFTVRRDLMGKTIINNYGLDGEGEFREVMIVGFLNKSDEDADCWSSNGDTNGTIAMTIDGWFYANELLKKCTFVDGSPCGKLVEEE